MAYTLNLNLSFALHHQSTNDDQFDIMSKYNKKCFHMFLESYYNIKAKFHDHIIFS